jgi:gamma-glutamylputrescine oxidase
MGLFCMQLSYWENKSWFTNVDFTIVGSGIVGLNCALSLRKRYPESRILVLERGMLPSGASTKNAGFACFGSVSEILEDLQSHSEEEVIRLVKKRVDGLKLLRENLGDGNIDLQLNGGFELFRKMDFQLYETCLEQINYINTLLKPLFPEKAFTVTEQRFGFQNIIPKSFFTPFEGQIDTGKMMASLIKKSAENDILILNGAAVTEFSEQINNVSIQLSNSFEFKTNKLLITTNGFANEILNEDLQPARAQVIITKPIKNLIIKGNFHLDRGYNYFRNIDGRVLLGGGRNLDFKSEQTTEQTITAKIQTHLETLLKEVVLPGTPFEIETRWSGTMGIGPQKKPIVKQLSNNVFCGVRMGGMGIAIGSIIGKDLAELI